MDARMQGFHAAIHDFWKAGDRGHVGDRNTCFAQQRRCAPGGEQLHALGRKAAGQRGDACLLTDAEQCPPDLTHVLFLESRA